jgi:hypothetical protein
MEAPDIAELARLLDGAGAHERAVSHVAELTTEAATHLDNITSDADARGRWRAIISGLINGVSAG